MSPPPLRLLILDDDEIFLDGVAAWFAAHHWSVHPARSSEEANGLLKSGVAFDLLLADIYLPNQRPLQWVEELLAQPDHPPVFLITGNPSLETACRAANLPVEGYLLKPLDLPREEARLRNVALARRQLSAGEAGWRAAVRETIEVLRQTKRSFQSKELGSLRAKLQRLDEAAMRRGHPDSPGKTPRPASS